MEYLKVLSYFNGTNYNVMNVNNTNNCFLEIMRNIEDDDIRNKIIESIKINIGMKYFNQLKMYLYIKCPKSDILKYFN